MTTTRSRNDLVLTGARLLDPVTGELLPQTALLARDGMILALGTDRECRSQAAADATVIDVKNAVVTPGLVEGHLHPVHGVERTNGVDLSHCQTLDQVRETLSKAVPGLKPGQWLSGWGLDPNCFGETPQTADALGPDLNQIPVRLVFFDGHATLASHRALELAGIDGPRHFNDASEIVCDEDGKPTGLLLENSVEVLEAAMPGVTVEELTELTRSVFAEMAATGITNGHAMDAEGNTLEVLRRLDDGDRLDIRFWVGPWVNAGTTSERIPELLRMHNSGGHLWNISAAKFFLDGTIDNSTAWLHEPDTLGLGTESLWPDPEEYTAAVIACHTAGMPTATHAIGDAAVDYALDSVARAIAAVGATPPSTVRHRIEHIESVPDTTIQRFKQLGVTPSMQPLHCTEYTLADHTDNWSRRLGEQRASRAFRCRDLRDACGRLVLGSDWPIAVYPPLLTMAAARHRHRTTDLSLPPHNPDQALTPLETLQGMTIDPAWVAGEEEIAGRIAPGMRADLTVFAENPLTTNDFELADLPVQLTICDGRITHRGATL